MALGQSLEGGKGMGHTQEVGLRIDGVVMLWHLFHHKMTDTTTIEVVDVAMTVVALGLQREEKGLLRETETAAVCEQPTDIALAMTITTGTYQGCNFLY